MKRSTAIGLMAGLGTLAFLAVHESRTLIVAKIASSHVSANVPPEVDFDWIFTRDVQVFFTRRGLAVSKIDYELLRARATQTGISYPKYYAWVTAYSGPSVVSEGVIRVAAVGRSHFDVTDFVSRSDISSNPAELRPVFPEPLIADIVARAGHPAGPRPRP